MALFTSIASIASALGVGGIASALGVAGTVAGVVEQKKSRRRLAAEQAKQEQRAKEAAALKTTKKDADARISIGADDPTAPVDPTVKKKKSARTTSGAALGGVSTSTLGGL